MIHLALAMGTLGKVVQCWGGDLVVTHCTLTCSDRAITRSHFPSTHPSSGD